MLQVLDIGNNINDIFPIGWELFRSFRYLFSIPINPMLFCQVQGGTFLFQIKLRILYLSDNDFSGPLPTRYFESVMAMKSIGEGERELKYLGQKYYQDSVRVTLKGIEVELVRILTIFTTIDLSINSFHGEILEVIGEHRALKVLNFSLNSLTGRIPTSLARLNLPQNQLVGSIPRGNQFDTFENDSYIGSLGLCGWPLSKKCSSDEAPETPSSESEGNGDLFLDGLGWKAVVIGYGSGVVVGNAVGYIVFLTGKPRSLVRIIERNHHRKMRKTNQRHRETRNS
ncbi:PREDICTED: receptor-like protein 12 [Theobroma cacao]|uniref:Receptor-like protein 12 n=1 Tax=Theobroma cacao TaxID=3641 RepID=A0AB32X2N2_THECC|nr:PREDICTED: receptor-like protein 12 [Theobroma cacao]